MLLCLHFQAVGSETKNLAECGHNYNCSEYSPSEWSTVSVKYVSVVHTPRYLALGQTPYQLKSFNSHPFLETVVICLEMAVAVIYGCIKCTVGSIKTLPSMVWHFLPFCSVEFCQKLLQITTTYIWTHTYGLFIIIFDLR